MHGGDGMRRPGGPGVTTGMVPGGKPPKAGPGGMMMGGGMMVPRPPGTLPRLEPLQRMPSMSARQGGAYGARGGNAASVADRLVMWTPLDDQ